MVSVISNSSELRFPTRRRRFRFGCSTAIGPIVAVGGRKDKFPDFIDPAVSVPVPDIDERARVFWGEEQVTHQISARRFIPPQAVHEVLNHVRQVFLMLARKFCQIDRRGNQECG
jgi:hypothetical protein